MPVEARTPPRSFLRIAAWFCFLLYACLVAFIVLWPSHVDDNSGGELLKQFLATGHSAGWLPAWFGYGAVEWLSNVLMFVPGGFLLFFLLPGQLKYWVPCLGLITSCGIEAIQHFMPDRTSSLWDVLANSLGASLGWVLAILLSRLRIGWRSKGS